MINKQHGFTLMEILLVTVLMAVIGVATANVFANGLKLWAKSSQVIREADVIVFFDRFGADLRSAYVLDGIVFKGLGAELTLPGVVVTAADENSSRAHEVMVDQLGAVQYRFDPAGKKIYRRQANYSQALKGRWGAEVAVASNIEEISFQYFLPAGQGLQVKSVVDGELPSGVSIDIRFEGDEYERRLHRFFPVMVGGGL